MSDDSGYLSCITLTGVDPHTDLNRLGELLRTGVVEAGFLYAQSRAGNPKFPKYPTREWIEQSSRSLPGPKALHICMEDTLQTLAEGKLDRLVEPFGRIQLNGNFRPELYPMLAAIAARFSDREIITQYNASNRDFSSIRRFANHAILMDPSGGLGWNATPADWMAPEVDMPVGFAGGLGPDNLSARLLDVEMRVKGRSWVDMEGKLRTNGFLDIAKAERVVKIFRAHLLSMQGVAMEAASMHGVSTFNR